MVRFSMPVSSCNSSSVHPILHDTWLTTGFLSPVVLWHLSSLPSTGINFTAFSTYKCHSRWSTFLFCDITCMWGKTYFPQLNKKICINRSKKMLIFCIWMFTFVANRVLVPDPILPYIFHKQFKFNCKHESLILNTLYYVFNSFVSLKWSALSFE